MNISSLVFGAVIDLILISASLFLIVVLPMVLWNRERGISVGVFVSGIMISLVLLLPNWIPITMNI